MFPLELKSVRRERKKERRWPAAAWANRYRPLARHRSERSSVLFKGARPRENKSGAGLQRLGQRPRRRCLLQHRQDHLPARFFRCFSTSVFCPDFLFHVRFVLSTPPPLLAAASTRPPARAFFVFVFCSTSVFRLGFPHFICFVNPAACCSIDRTSCPSFAIACQFLNSTN